MKLNDILRVYNSGYSSHLIHGGMLKEDEELEPMEEEGYVELFKPTKSSKAPKEQSHDIEVKEELGFINPDQLEKYFRVGKEEDIATMHSLPYYLNQSPTVNTNDFEGMKKAVLAVNKLISEIKKFSELSERKYREKQKDIKNFRTLIDKTADELISLKDKEIIFLPVEKRNIPLINFSTAEVHDLIQYAEYITTSIEQLTGLMILAANFSSNRENLNEALELRKKALPYVERFDKKAIATPKKVEVEERVETEEERIAADKAAREREKKKEKERKAKEKKKKQKERAESEAFELSTMKRSLEEEEAEQRELTRQEAERQEAEERARHEAEQRRLYEEYEAHEAVENLSQISLQTEMQKNIMTLYKANNPDFINIIDQQYSSFMGKRCSKSGASKSLKAAIKEETETEDIGAGYAFENVCESGMLQNTLKQISKDPSDIIATKDLSNPYITITNDVGVGQEQKDNVVYDLVQNNTFWELKNFNTSGYKINVSKRSITSHGVRMPIELSNEITTDILPGLPITKTKFDGNRGFKLWFRVIESEGIRLHTIIQHNPVSGAAIKSITKDRDYDLIFLWTVEDGLYSYDIRNYKNDFDKVKTQKNTKEKFTTFTIKPKYIDDELNYYIPFDRLRFHPKIYT